MKAAALELRAAAILNEMRARTLDNQKGGPLLSLLVCYLRSLAVE
jgi:hypothetical protein